MVRAITMQDVSWFLDLKEKGQLDLDPPYQRRSVWSIKDKRYFIDTILNNYPAPPVFLHKTLDELGRTNYHVVDGKQRLQTIIEFAENRIRIPEDFSDIKLQKKLWDDLDRPTKEKFWNYVLVTEMLPETNDAAIKNIFERINRNSRKLTPQEMRHAKYDGWFISFVENESKKEEWKDYGVVTPSRIKRMADVQFISELCAVVLKNCLLGFDQNRLDQMYADYEDIVEIESFVEDDFHQEVVKIKQAITRIISLSPDTTKFLKVQSHFYTLWGYLHLQKLSTENLEYFTSQYTKFLHSVEIVNHSNDRDKTLEIPHCTDSFRQAVLNYAKNLRGASTDLTPRTERHGSLVSTIESQATSDHENS